MSPLDLPDLAGPVDVVIDTDVGNEIDDQFAVAWALLRPDRLRVRALHACPWASGPALYTRPDMDPAADRRATDAARDVGPAEGVDVAVAELRRIVRLAGRDETDVPVLRGADRFLAAPDQPVVSEATEHLIALAHEPRAGRLHVLGIGCATNLASALLVDPTIAERVTVAWTSAYPSFFPYPNSSYNLCLDTTASRVLLDSGVPLVYLPGYYVGEELRVTRADLERHVRGQGALGDYLWEVYDSHWMSGSTEPGFSKVIWDLINVAYVVDPGWLSTALVPTPVLGDDLRWEHPPGRHTMREAWDLNRDAVFGDLYRVLADRRPPNPQGTHSERPGSARILDP